MTGTKRVAISWHRELLLDAVFEHIGDAERPTRHDLPAGAAELSERKDGQPFLTFVCPCGCGVLEVLPLAPARTLGESGWDWDTSAPDPRTLPTLWPSIWRKHGCGWHGHLTKGVWVSCSAS